MKILKKLRLRTYISLGLIMVLLPVILIALYRPGSADAEWFNESWAFRRKLTINNAQVSGSTALSNFPIMVSFSADSDLSSGAQSSGDDILFTNSDGVKLDHEIESYSAGTLIAWVRIPSLSATTNTNIYMYYGNPSAINQENPEAVWDENYVLVQHLSYNCTTADCYKDSTSYNNDSSAVTFDGSGDPNATGIAGTGVYFDGTNDHIGIADNDTLDFGTGSFSIEAWASSTVDSQDYFLSKQSATVSPGWAMRIESSSGSNAYRWGITDTTSFPKDSATSTTTGNNDGAWHYIAGTKNGTSDIQIYLEGTSEATDSSLGSTGTLSNSIDLEIGMRTNSSASFVGYMDEVRISNIERSGDWLATTYNTIKTPGSFITTATQEKGTGPIAYWRFDEGSNNSCSGGTNDTCDSTPNAIDGAFSATTPTWRTPDLCLSGNCLEFNGSSSNIDFGDNSIHEFTNGTDFTINFWINAPLSGTSTVIAKKNATTVGNSGYMVTVSGSGIVTVYFSDGTDQLQLTTSSGISSNTWTFVSIVYDDDSTANTDVYFNGNAQNATETGTLANVDNIGVNSVALNIGSESDDQVFLDGKLDEVKFYTYARSSTQLKSDYASRGGYQGDSSTFGGDQSYLSDGLVGYWTMDEAADATRADSSGNENTLTESAADTIDQVQGKFGYAGDFELADTEYMTAADSSSLSITGSLTLSAWINPETISAGSYNIIAKWDGSNESYRLFQNGDEIRLELDSAGNYEETSAANLAVSTWYHVVGVYDSQSATAKIYINGDLATSSTTGTIPSSIGDDTGLFHLGAEDSTGGATGYYDGIIEEARVYNRVLDDIEIRSLYNWTAGPIIHYKFDENQGTSTVHDTSGNSKDATMNGSMTNRDWHPGRYGGALKFDETDDYLYNSSPNLPTRDFTYEFWIKLDAIPSAGTYSILASHDTAAGNEFRIIYDESPDISVALNDVTIMSGGANFAPDIWYHYAIVRKGSAITAYLDGIIDQTATDGTVLDFQGCGLYISSESDSGCDDTGNHIGAHLDDLRIYNYARTPGQIAEDMNAGHPMGGSPISSAMYYWSLDEGYGTLAHTRGYVPEDLSLNGTGGTPTWKSLASCILQGCMEFDGSNDVLGGSANTLGDTDTINNMTFSAWINADTVGDAEYIVFKGEGEVDTTELEADNARFFLRWDTTSGNDLEYGHEYSTGSNEFHIFDTNLSTSTWYYVAFTRNTDTNTVKLYVNGILIESWLYTNDPTGGDGGEFGVGADDDSNTGTNFDGHIDEVKIYEDELTLEEILIDMNANSAANFGTKTIEATDDVSMPEPAGSWSFNENTGTTVNDSSTNAYTGTLTNMTNDDWVPGKYGSGLDFDGSDDFVDVGVSSSTVRSISLWVKPTTTTEHIIDLNGTDYLAVSSGTLDYNGDASETIYVNGVVSTTLAADVWQHIVVVNSASDNASDLDIGRLEGTDNFSGLIDDVRIYNSALTLPQAIYEFNRGRPQHWYKFDECEGSTAYDSGYLKSNGTINTGDASGDNDTVGTCGSGTSTEMWNDGTTGKRNASLGFDGQNGTGGDYVDIASPGLPTADFTYTAWVYHNSSSYDYIFLALDGAGSNEMAIAVNSSDQVDVILNGGTDTGTGTISTGAWHHIAVTRSGSSGSIYIDGKLDSTFTDSNTLNFSTCDLLIGIDADATCTGTLNQSWDGLIDDARIYNYAVSAVQVKKIMNDDAGTRFGPDTGSP